MKQLIFASAILLSASLSWGALLSPSAELRNRSGQTEVRPPVGILGMSDCAECQKEYMGGVMGASAADLELLRKHEREIFGAESGQSGGRADTIQEEN